MPEFMQQFLHILGWPALLFTALCSGTLFVQIMCATRRTTAPRAPADASLAADLPADARVAVLIPAHNESSGIARTLASVLPQLGPQDMALVVADNCTDDTAHVARQAGAMVTERHNTELRGKGYALAHGVAHLSNSPPTHVLLIDADCVLHPGSLQTLLQNNQLYPGPLQACDLMQAPEGSGVGTRIAEFAWLVKNDLRPSGSARIGWPCQLMGTGMMFPWALLKDAPLASGHLAEDMQLGIHLAQQGVYPRYCRSAMVTSLFPAQAAAQIAQRQRWEHGHLQVILHHALPTLWKAAVQRSWRMLGMGLDMMIPPLAALILVEASLATLLFVGWTAGLKTGNMLAGASINLLLLFLAVARAWQLGGRDVVSLADLRSVPLYVLSKLSIYANYFSRQRSAWVRASRDGDTDTGR